MVLRPFFELDLTLRLCHGAQAPQTPHIPFGDPCITSTEPSQRLLALLHSVRRYLFHAFKPSLLAARSSASSSSLADLDLQLASAQDRSSGHRFQRSRWPCLSRHHRRYSVNGNPEIELEIIFAGAGKEMWKIGGYRGREYPLMLFAK